MEDDRARSRSRSREGEWRGDDSRPEVDDSRRDGETQPLENEGTNLYITNLFFRTTDESLRAAFSAYGEVLSASVVKEPATQTSRHLDDAERAISAMNGNDLEGRAIKVEKARRNKGYEKTPGKYLGPPQMSSKFSTRDGGGGGYRGVDRPSRGYDRDYDRGAGGYDRGSYDRGGGGGYRGGGGGDRGAPSYREDGRYSSGRGGPADYGGAYSGGGGGGGYRDDRSYGGDYSKKQPPTDTIAAPRDYERRADYYPSSGGGYSAPAPAVDYSRGRPAIDYDDRRAPSRDYPPARDPRDVRSARYDDRPAGYSAPPSGGGYDSRAARY